MFKKLLFYFLSLLFCLLNVSPASAAEDFDPSGHSVVKVAFPIQPGLTELDPYGNCCGYTYEYLEEIAQYTGWDYEFIMLPGDPDESLPVFVDMLQNGEIDFIGGILYNEENSQRFDFSSQSYGVMENVLQVPYDSIEPILINSQVPQSFRIAILEDAAQMRQELEAYCAMNLVIPEYVLCRTKQEQLSAIQQGKADMMLSSTMEYIEGVRTIARFASKPFYFVTAKGKNLNLITALNGAIMDIEQSDPYFKTTLYEKYFLPANKTLLLNQKEIHYIHKADLIKVGVLTTEPPYQYLDRYGNLKGVAVDLLRYISRQAGLQFEYLPAATPEALYQMLHEGTVQIIASIPYDYHLARQQHFSMTRPYITAQYMLLRQEDNLKKELSDLQPALLYQSELQHRLTKEQILWFDTLEECINAVSEGKAGYTCLDAYTAQYYLHFPKYQALKMLPQTYGSHALCFGISKPSNRQLLSIFNKTIATLPNDTLQNILNRNIVSEQTISLDMLIARHPFQTIAVLCAAPILIIVILLYILRQKAKMNQTIALQLKKHFQVYSLVNEYFLEYDFQTNSLQVFLPNKDPHGQPRRFQYDFFHSCQSAGEEKRARSFLKLLQTPPSEVTEAHLFCMDGKYHWLRLVLNIVYDAQGNPAYTLGKINVIDAEKQERAVLLKKAQLDGLTQIYNAETSHSLIRERLSQLSKGEYGGLLLIDIDYFKQINDTYGHIRGDQTLTRVAALLRSSCREEDIVGRPGGDEFIIYLNKIKDTQTLHEKCAFICEKAQTLLIHDDKALTFSIGACLTMAGDDYDLLYQKTDQALYTAKKTGRARFQIVERNVQKSFCHDNADETANECT